MCDIQGVKVKSGKILSSKFGRNQCLYWNKPYLRRISGLFLKYRLFQYKHQFLPNFELKIFPDLTSTPCIQGPKFSFRNRNNFEMNSLWNSSKQNKKKLLFSKQLYEFHLWNVILFSRYLDKVFQPQWERFQVSQPKKYNGYSNNHDINQDQVKPGGCSEFCNVL